MGLMSSPAAGLQTFDLAALLLDDDSQLLDQTLDIIKPRAQHLTVLAVRVGFDRLAHPNHIGTGHPCLARYPRERSR